MGNAAVYISHHQGPRHADPLRPLARLYDGIGASTILAARRDADSTDPSDPDYCPLRMLAWSTSLSAALWCGLILGGIALRNIWR